MLYTPLTKKCLKYCFNAHKGQVDKNGIPYVNHPLHLAEQMNFEEEVCVALLHDVIEDCGASLDELKGLGLPDSCLRALSLLTHRHGVPYLDYVQSIKDNALATKVKIADLRHNSELSRLDQVNETDIQRLRKYMEARVVLGDMAYKLETPAGDFTVEVNGEPYPFFAKNAWADPMMFYDNLESHKYDGRPLLVGRPDDVFYIEVETLPLSVGDRILLRGDFGDEIIDYGSDERVFHKVFSSNGYSMGFGACTDEEDDYPEEVLRKYGLEHSFNNDHWSYEYDIVRDPAQYRFQKFAHVITARLAWRKGTANDDAEIVGYVAEL